MFAFGRCDRIIERENFGKTHIGRSWACVARAVIVDVSATGENVLVVATRQGGQASANEI